MCYYGAIHFHSNFCKFFGGIQFLRVLLVRFFLNVSFTVYSSDSSGGFLFFVSPLLFPISNILLFTCYRGYWLA